MLFLLFVNFGLGKGLKIQWCVVVEEEISYPSQIFHNYMLISFTHLQQKQKLLPAVNSLFVHLPDVMAFLLESRGEEHHFS